MKFIKTGEVLPLDYGLVDHIQGQTVLWTPTNVARGKFMTSTKSERKEMLRQSALVTGILPQDLELLVREGVLKQHKHCTSIDDAPNQIVTNVHVYNNLDVIGKVTSQSGGKPIMASFSVANTSDGARVHGLSATSETTIVGKVKGAIAKGYVNPHVAALIQALAHDYNQTTNNSITQLKPSERDLPKFYLPFRALKTPLGTGDVIAQYYGIGDNQFTTSVDYFRRCGLDFAIRKRLHEGNAHLGVVVNRVARKDADTLSSSDRELYASIGTMIEALAVYAKTNNFTSIPGRNFAREFTGSNFATIARRFERGNEVLHILGGMTRKRNDGEVDIVPPVMLYRKLDQSVIDSPNVASNFSPFDTTSSSSLTVDDTTRRVGVTHIYIPGISARIPAPTSKVLEQAYTRWLR